MDSISKMEYLSLKMPTEEVPVSDQKRICCVQFASIPDFLIRMQTAKFLPHTDKSRFPSV